jgi:hypothetical protein
MTIEELRNSGYKVKIFHNRLYNGYHAWQNGRRVYGYTDGIIGPDTKGGSTEVIIQTPTGERLHGIAICSTEDNYNKKLGVKIAFGRALYANESIRV